MNSGPVARERFARADRLRKRREFEECYASGVRASGRHVQVFLLPGPGPIRLGISVPRRIGTAVARNRVRRRLREIFRRTRAIFGGLSGSLVVNVRPGAAGVPFLALSDDYRTAVARALARLPRP